MNEFSFILQLAIICLLLVLIGLVSYYIIKGRKKTHFKKDISKQNIPKIEVNIVQNPQEEKLMDLFQMIDNAIQTEKLYTNPQLSKSDVIIRFNTNRNKLNQILQHGCGMGYSEYICELRLKESVRLMKSHETMSLNDVSEQCGFKTYSSFYRHFIRKYKVSPAEFKDRSNN